MSDQENLGQQASSSVLVAEEGMDRRHWLTAGVAVAAERFGAVIRD